MHGINSQASESCFDITVGRSITHSLGGQTMHYWSGAERESKGIELLPKNHEKC
jgi:hypothetical protein